MFSVICVLKSGGIYDSSWVEKLKNGVKRNLARPHRFVCLSDVDVPCERIPLQHDWPGWWSKIELFRPEVISGDTLYLDLDTAITGDLEPFVGLETDFAMIRSFANPAQMASGVMYFGKPAPTKVYEKFSRQPDAYIAHHARNQNGAYLGDQAFISDTLGRNIACLNDMVDGIAAYKYHCHKRLMPGTKIVCFPGDPKPTDLKDDWVLEAWK